MNIDQWVTRGVDRCLYAMLQHYKALGKYLISFSMRCIDAYRQGPMPRVVQHAAQPQNSISLDQAHEIPGVLAKSLDFLAKSLDFWAKSLDFLAKSLDNTVLHGERVACASIVDTVSLSTVIQ